MRKIPVVLSIAGSDSGGGAGIQADCRTIHALGGFAVTAITAVTAQNTRGVMRWDAVKPALIVSQIETVLEDFSVAAIKTGLLPGAACVNAIGPLLRRHSLIPLVIDPVIGSTTGTRFLSAVGLRALKRELFPRAQLVTPNWPEAAILSGLCVDSYEDVEPAARRILESGCGAVLVKGGHGPGGVCRDCLISANGQVTWYWGERIKTKNTHGTGCVLSSAIAIRLASGDELPEAVDGARKFLRRQLLAGRNVRLGHGAGPAFVGIG